MRKRKQRYFTVTTVTSFCFTHPNSDGLYSPPLNSWKFGKWLKTLAKGCFSRVFENGVKLSPPLRHSGFPSCCAPALAVRDSPLDYGFAARLPAWCNVIILLVYAVLCMAGVWLRGVQRLESGGPHAVD